MKILLDECVTKHLKPHLSDHEVSTVRELGWSGIQNGKLMTLCVEHQFDIILTIDKNLQYQQDLERYPLTIVILNSFTSKIEELVEFLPALRSKISTLQKHKAYIIEK
jgi:predicted nuclease of predicted toxin-antitoxin system